MRPLLLGIDVGTSTAKAVLADVDGKELYTASRRYGYEAPNPDWAEQSPETWWSAVAGAVHHVVEAAGDAGRVAGIAVSGQGVAAVLLGQDGTPLRPAMLWMDCRASEETLALSPAAERFISIAGKAPGAYNVEPKLMWVRKHEPAVWQHLWKVTTTTGYITYRLTGNPVMNHSDAGVLMAYDLKRQRWSEELLDLMGLSPGHFCDLAPSTEVVGTLTAEAGRDLGLPPGVPVVAGGEDTSAAGLAAGAVEPGHAFLSLGTASTLYVPVQGAPVDSRLLTFPHVISGLSLIGGSMISGGGAFEWLAKLLCGNDLGGDGWIESLSREAQTSPAGASGLVFLPYLAGELQPVSDSLARGVFLGLSFGTRRGDLVRAVMEGVAYAINHNAETIAELAGPIASFRAVGGPTRNPLWCQIIADVTGREVIVYDDRAGAPLADAALAAAGVGLVEAPYSLIERHVRPTRTYHARDEAHVRYRQLFQVYLEVYPRVKHLFPALRMPT